MFSIFKSVPSISIEELERLVKKDIKLIDVRTPDEFKKGHIKGAKNVPLNYIEDYKGTETVYVICQSGMRSKRAVKALRKHGVDAINVRGGMSMWRGHRVIGKK
ncbi:rhodanese-like domain-containing protein [Macrococcus armenti]|uniref:rhodanese-like domain-containing protein n=1 Tax=Macrococcus armenti TaxID=2875764 RepID=UPI001CD76F13|nr:rhodanese-like domain-containing protein [Macrococcus armenti]UBH10954.1 rhodanese-like domain-containing protein [Macrococcus armenti]